MLLVVNYHYVSPARVESPRGTFPVAVRDLVAQVELLARSFELVGRDAVERAVEGKALLPDRACLITFDDGLRTQAELALPALLGLGVVPLFLVPGRPLSEGRALYVHKVHHLRDVLPARELAERLPAVLAQLELDAVDVTDERAAAAYAYDRLEDARLKFLLNYALPLAERERVVDALFREVVESERAFCDELYMPAEVVAELERAHGAVGAHSYAHEPLALLRPSELRADLEASADALEAVTGSRPRTLSYPHGSTEAVDRSVAAAAEAAGFRVGFTMERALNRTLADPLLLARIDANDALGGSRPLLSADDAGRILTSGPMTPARTRYRDELPSNAA